MAQNGLASGFTGRILPNIKDPNAFEDVRGDHAVMYPASEADLAIALTLCKQSHREFIIRSGHNTVSTDTVNGEGAVVINMEELSGIHVEGCRVTVGPAATMQNFARTLYQKGLFLPFRDTLIKTVAAGVLSRETGMLTRSAGLITSYLQEIHVVKNDGTPAIANKDDDLFNAVLAKEDDSVISSLVFDALTEKEAEKFWMTLFYLPYQHETFKQLVGSAFEAGKLPSTVDLAVKVTHGQVMVRVSVAGKDGSSDREAVMKHVEHVMSADNLGDVGFEIPRATFRGKEAVKAIVDGGDTGAFSHGYIPTKHTRLVLGSRFPDFVDPYCKAINAANGGASDGKMYLPNVSMKSQVSLTPDGNMGVTAFLFVPPGGMSRHTEEQKKIDEYKVFLNRILPLDAAPPTRRSFRLAPVKDIAGFLDDIDLTISSMFDASALGKMFPEDPLKLALQPPEERIPGFKGKVFMKDDKQYEVKADQYATSSYDPKDMSPFMVTYPEDVQDIQAAIAYGKQEGLKIVARSGGHQYSGLSSGGDDTIVLSMDLFKTLVVKGTLATVGVGSRLTKIAEAFKGAGVTIPHGECPLVAIGGHCQTGGYGHLLRSFGLALDHVHSFNIVLADGTFRTVHRPAKHVDWQKQNDKIFWGVLGGGPNSFGILTEVTFECIDDDMHPNSRGHKSVALFKKPAFSTVMKEVQRWTVEIEKGSCDYLPDDLDMMASVVSTDLPVAMPPVLLLEMVYGNENGASESAAQVAKAQSLMTKISDDVKDAEGEFGFRRVEIDETDHTVLSYMSDSFVRQTGAGTTEDGREFKYPYEKRLNGTKHALTDGFVEDFVDLVEESANDRNVRIVFQMGLGGGKVLGNKKLGLTSHSRRDVVWQVVYDVFYTDGQKEVALGYQERMKGILEQEFKGEGENIRLIWGSYGDTDVNKVWENYYDNEALYKKLQGLKKEVDPDDVFHTRFTVQLPPAHDGWACVLH